MSESSPGHSHRDDWFYVQVSGTWGFCCLVFVGFTNEPLSLSLSLSTNVCMYVCRKEGRVYLRLYELARVYECNVCMYVCMYVCMEVGFNLRVYELARVYEWFCSPGKVRA